MNINEYRDKRDKREPGFKEKSIESSKKYIKRILKKYNLENKQINKEE